MNAPDPFSGRTIAADALGVLEDFRRKGARPFHTYPVDELRPLYERSCAANGLVPDPIASVKNYAAGKFALRVYQTHITDQPTAAVLFFHGGGWVMGNLDTHDPLCRRLATLTGLPVVAVDYRLAPEHPYPAAREDCTEALQWLFEASDVHGVDITHAVLAGDSAGGQLAATLTIDNARSDRTYPVAGQMLLYPITDLTMSTRSYQRMTSGYPLVAGTMSWFISQYLPADAHRAAPDVSPLFADLPPGLPPAFVLTVDNDPLADEGGLYAAKLAQTGTDVVYRHLPGYAHGLFTSAGRIPTAENAIAEMADFIRKWADPAASSTPAKEAATPTKM